ncbi:MAG TPA: hypothetical protein VLK85_13035 [Ramlibacter sp.]|nr:hypothetical protein [Ramlibacter sp.]
MISKKTVFVLGAGASCPFGLPTGGQLRAMFCEQLSGTDHKLSRSLTDCGFSANTIRAFGRDFMFSGVMSIDSFLATRSEYHEIGVHAIAATLLPQEAEVRLYKRGPAGQVKWGDSDWYGYLWNRMRADVTQPDQLLMNQVSFITFNYDRTFEVFMLNSIQHTFGLERDAAFEILQRTPIHHVYGSLGEYEGSKGGFGFGRATSAEIIKASAQRLRVVPSARPSSDDRCTELLSSAETVIFLGFGFDSTNCARLGFRSLMESREAQQLPQVVGTSFGMKRGEEELAVSQISTPSLVPSLISINCLDLLRLQAALLAG